MQQAVALRTDVPDLQHHLARKLLLQVEVVILHVRRGKVAVYRKNVPGRGARWSHKCRNSRKYRSGRADRGNRVRTRGIVSYSWTKLAVVRQFTKKDVLGNGVKKESPSCAQHGAALAEGIPSHTDARREVFVVRFVYLTQAGLTQLRQSDGLPDWIEIRNVGKEVVLLAYHPVVVPAESVIERQSWDRVKTILYIQSIIIFVGMAD